VADDARRRLAVIAGAVVLTEPGNSLKTLAVITGIFVLVDGICELVAGLNHGQANRGLVAVLGLVTAIEGVLLIRHPVGSVTAVAILIGIWLIATGWCDASRRSRSQSIVGGSWRSARSRRSPAS
jgi:uncharacterized membrane protein HdeD (DUF308 family)